MPHTSPLGTVFNIQRYSIHDGPGIRTLVFLKGCPLSCHWCCNPESQHTHAEVLHEAASCLRCGACVEACPKGALSLDHPRFIDRERCDQCLACISACLPGALTVKGEVMKVDEVVQILRKDEPHYRRSGGGITLSGGEPLSQPDFAKALLRACKEQGWSTAMETTALAPVAVIEEVMPLVDLALLDIKCVDSLTHQRHTGVPNEHILENARRIATLTRTEVRVPTIPGFNADVASMEAIGRFAQSLPGVDTVHILPYHTYGENKYKLLGREYPLDGLRPLSAESTQQLKGVIENLGLHCVIGG